MGVVQRVRTKKATVIRSPWWLWVIRSGQLRTGAAARRTPENWKGVGPWLGMSVMISTRPM